MATIGLGAMLRGLPPITVGGETRAVSLGIGDMPIGFGPISLPPIQILGVVVTLGFLALFTWFFLKSRMGVAMRAVADNQQVAMAMGINVERYFALAWAMAGTVSALGGVIWGSMLGVDVHLALVGLKVFPVVILGGLDSVLGAVVGGLIVGVVESLAAGYLDPYVGGGTKDFAPYVLMIIMLDVQAVRHLRHAQNRAGIGGRRHAASRVRRLQDQLRRRHGAVSAADRALDGCRRHPGVRRHRAAVAARLLPVDHQSRR